MNNNSLPNELLQTNIAGMSLRNPVMTASGTFGCGREYSELMDISRLGAIVVKGVSLQPWKGNSLPRLAETPAGMLNAIGLQNPGVDHFIAEDLPWIAQRGPAVIVNIVGKSVAEYAAVAEKLSAAAGIAALEVNISCPNIKEGGLSFGVDPKAAADVIKAVRSVSKLPLIAKLSPNVADIAVMAQAVAAAGADAISLINTLLGMVIDVDKKRPLLGNVMGGLSGPAIRPVAVRMVWQVYQAVDLPIIGMGGIACGRDALEFIMAGASAIAVGSATFRNPQTAVNIVDELAQYCRRTGCAIHELVGVAHHQ